MSDPNSPDQTPPLDTQSSPLGPGSMSSETNSLATTDPIHPQTTHCSSASLPPDKALPTSHLRRNSLQGKPRSSPALRSARPLSQSAAPTPGKARTTSSRNSSPALSLWSLPAHKVFRPAPAATQTPTAPSIPCCALLWEPPSQPHSRHTSATNTPRAHLPIHAPTATRFPASSAIPRETSLPPFHPPARTPAHTDESPQPGLFAIPPILPAAPPKAPPAPDGNSPQNPSGLLASHSVSGAIARVPERSPRHPAAYPFQIVHWKRAEIFRSPIPVRSIQSPECSNSSPAATPPRRHTAPATAPRRTRHVMRRTPASPPPHSTACQPTRA